MFHVYGHRLANILQKAIDEFCYKSLPQNYDLEIDGLVYIGEIGSHKQAVLKLNRNIRSCNGQDTEDTTGESIVTKNKDKNGTVTNISNNQFTFGQHLTGDCDNEIMESLNSNKCNQNNYLSNFKHQIATLPNITENMETDNNIKQKSEADSTFVDDLLSPSTFVDVPSNEIMTQIITKANGRNKDFENGSLKEDPDQIYECCSSTWVGFPSYESHFFAKHLRHPCPLCSQSFTSRNNMRRHVNCNHGEKKRFECSICEKLFTRPDIVKEHKLTHTKSYKDNKCSLCQFVSTKKTTLLVHLKRCLKYENIDQDIVDAPLLPLNFSSKLDQINQ